MIVNANIEAIINRIVNYKLDDFILNLRDYKLIKNINNDNISYFLLRKNVAYIAIPVLYAKLHSEGVQTSINIRIGSHIYHKIIMWILLFIYILFSSERMLKSEFVQIMNNNTAILIILLIYTLYLVYLKFNFNKILYIIFYDMLKDVIIEMDGAICNYVKR
jgi:hypothetical protein